jgi:hypothetical protein
MKRKSGLSAGGAARDCLSRETSRFPVGSGEGMGRIRGMKEEKKIIALEEE